MNRNSFVTNQKVKKIFSVVEILKIGSVWKSVDSHLHTRIKSFRGIENGKYVYETETCVYPRWFKRNPWQALEWRVDEIYIRHDFPKRYIRTHLLEPMKVKIGFKWKYVPRYLYLIGMGCGLVSLEAFLIKPSPITFLKAGAWICILINAYWYSKAKKVENRLEMEFPDQKD